MAIFEGLITVADAKTSLGIATAVTTYDTDLETYISAATPVIERFTGALILRPKTYIFDGGDAAILLPERVASITSVTESGTATTDWTADLTHGILYGGSTTAGRAFRDGHQNITVVCVTGSATLPPNTLLAARELVRFWWQIGRQANRPGVGETNQALEDPPTGLLKRVAQLCEPTYSLPGFA